jgi:hypothetical protein
LVQWNYLVEEVFSPEVLLEHGIGKSGADSCKFNISNYIRLMCKGWADVFQMPHHRQAVKRCTTVFNPRFYRTIVINY